MTDNTTETLKRYGKKGKKSKPKWEPPVPYGKYKDPESKSDPISTKFDEGAVSFDDKFKKMYFNRAIMKRRESHSPRIYQLSLIHISEPTRRS